MSSTANNNNVHGIVAPAWENVRAVFEQNIIDELDLGASLCVYHRGQCVVDLSGGWKDVEKTKPYTPETLQIVYSTSKGVIAAAVALCVDKGWLDYDAPVAKYWPEFAAEGKENITVGEVLSHRAGLPYVDQQLTADDVYNWSHITALLAAEKPHWIPGSAHGYHAHTLGFLAGELVHRVDPKKRSYDQFVRDELEDGFYVGVSDDKIEARVAPLIRKQVNTNTAATPPMPLEAEKALTFSGAFPLNQPDGKILFNSPRLHRAEMPATNGITNARSLARIYALLIGDIDENGSKKKRLVHEETLARAAINMTPIDEPDQNSYGLKTTFAKGGFQIYGKYFNALGEGIFGHTGRGGSCVFAYPPHELAYAHVCNQLDTTAFAIDRRTLRLLEAIKDVIIHLNAS
ncbi:unnamed protein product [Adineta steineri]|uniref:Beta-lactamase-related domain-containing protein n=1 Tax=Adineta steineri TaxID=433720 RepID=A0A815B3D2_9BILA|nr:unnamed protein product [Adineta steineri]CAF1417131.1 unnamed protein product [Adineta steineri]